MLKFVAAVVAVGSIGFASAAMASGENGQSAGNRQLTWDQLRVACANPAAFQSQRPPSAIRVTCEDSRLVWEVDQSEAIEMDNKRHISTSLTSDKYSVARQGQAVSIDGTQAMCPRLREVEISYSKSFSLSCQEVQGFRGSLADYCVGALDQDLKTNKNLGSRRETGRAYDLCANPELVTQQPPKAQPSQPSQQPAQPSQQPSGKAGAGTGLSGFGGGMMIIQNGRK